MADKYVNPAVGASGTGESWAQAYKTLKEATDAAAAGENIYFANGTADPITVDTTYTLAAGVSVISTSDTTNNPPQTYATGATVDGSATSGVDINVSGTGTFYGVKLKVGNGANTGIISLVLASGDRLIYDTCTFEMSGTSAGTGIRTGNQNTIYAELITKNCSYIWTATGQGIAWQNSHESIGDDFSAGSTHPSVLGEIISLASRVNITGGDLSDISTVFEAGPTHSFLAIISNSKLKSGGTIFSPFAAGLGEVFVFNCSSGDNHYEFGHYTYYGSTIAVTSPYISDGALYDGTNHVTWKVVTGSACTFDTPYVTPWLETYHSGTSAITPSLEGLMIDDSTVAKDNEVWGEFSYQGTTGYTTATIVNDRMALLGTAADQTSSKTYSDWTASPATDSGDSVFKLATTSTITPAEIGFLRARVCVGEASKTIYIDPKIRT